MADNSKKLSIQDILRARAQEIAPKGDMPKATVKSVRFQRYTKPSGGVSGGFIIAAVAGLFLTLPIEVKAKATEENSEESEGYDIYFCEQTPSVRDITLNDDIRNTKVLGMIRVGEHTDPNCGFFVGGIPCGQMTEDGLNFLSVIKGLVEPIVERCSTNEGYEEVVKAGLIIEYKEKMYINLNMAEYNIPLVYYVRDGGNGLTLDPTKSEWSVSTSPGHVYGRYKGTDGASQMFRGYLQKNDRTTAFARALFPEIVKMIDKDLKECPRVSSAQDVVRRASGRASAFKTAAGATSGNARPPVTPDGIDFDSID